MIQPFLNQLTRCHIILGSSSPRRQEILRTVGLGFEVVPSTFEENLDIKDFPNAAEFVKETAKQKALDVTEKLKNTRNDIDLVIGADTVVMLDDVMFGKPKTKSTAIAMLEQLSGKMHKVYTGVSLIFPKRDKISTENIPHMVSFHEETGVIMCKMTPKVIEAYVNTGEPLDKAGAYGIQGIGGSLVEGIDGDYYNVMGFPLHRFCKEIHTLCQHGSLGT